MLTELRTFCGLCGLAADWDNAILGPCEPSSGGGKMAPQPVEDAGCSRPRDPDLQPGGTTGSRRQVLLYLVV
jgi:hypothetical protein